MPTPAHAVRLACRRARRYRWLFHGPAVPCHGLGTASRVAGMSHASSAASPPTPYVSAPSVPSHFDGRAKGGFLADGAKGQGIGWSYHSVMPMYFVQPNNALRTRFDTYCAFALQLQSLGTFEFPQLPSPDLLGNPGRYENADLWSHDRRIRMGHQLAAPIEYRSHDTITQHSNLQPHASA